MSGWIRRSNERRARLFIVGAHRSGTTYLCEMLDEHPEVCMAHPIIPEPKFFLGPDCMGNIALYERKYFQHATCRTRWHGEKSATYHEREDVAMRIAEAYPGATIIVILRHPVFRAISNYFYSRNNGLEPRSIEDVFVNHVPPPPYPPFVSTNPFNYIRRGEYAKYLPAYERHFGRERMIILTYETFVTKLAAVQLLYARLGIDPSFVPPSLNRSINANNNTRGVSEKIIASLAGHFRPHIADVAAFLGRPMDEWR